MSDLTEKNRLQRIARNVSGAPAETMTAEQKADLARLRNEVNFFKDHGALVRRAMAIWTTMATRGKPVTAEEWEKAIIDHHLVAINAAKQAVRIKYSDEDPRIIENHLRELVKGVIGQIRRAMQEVHDQLVAANPRAAAQPAAKKKK